jgi:hypothetical protein
MTALRIARSALLASVTIYAAALMFAVLQVGPPELVWPVGIFAAMGMALSAFACVLLQIRLALRALLRRIRAPRTPGEVVGPI